MRPGGSGRAGGRAHGGAVSHLIVTAGGVEGVGAAGEQRLVVARHQHFDVVVTFVLSGGGKQLDVIVR